MISIITCSRNPSASESLKRNLEATVGVPFEFIVVDNRENQYGICAAYNHGAGLSRYETLCFVHEDVCFETENWGRLLVNHLREPKVGLMGVAGGDTRSIVPSGWSIPIGSNEIHLVQHYRKEKKLAPRQLFESSAPPGVRSVRVAAVDGVFLATRAAVFGKFRFDDKNLKGFHGYDIDFSLQVGTRYEVRVIFDICLHHFSEGKQDRQWLRSAEIISEKWKKMLPHSVCKTVSAASLNLHHWHTLRIYIETLYGLGNTRTDIVAGYLKYSFTRFFHLRRFLSLTKFIFISLPWRRRKKNQLNVFIQAPVGSADLSL